MVRAIIISLICLLAVKCSYAQDTCLVFYQNGYNYLADTIHPMFADTLKKEMVDFTPVPLLGGNDSIAWVNDTEVTAPTYALSQQSLRDPNFIFIVAFIESQPQARYFKLKKVQVIYKKP